MNTTQHPWHLSRIAMFTLCFFLSIPLSLMAQKEKRGNSSSTKGGADSAEVQPAPKPVAQFRIGGLINERKWGNIADAKLTFKSVDGAVTKTVRSGANGRYTLALPAATYLLTVDAKGYKQVQSKVIVNGARKPHVRNAFLTLVVPRPAEAFDDNPRPVAGCVFIRQDGGFGKRIGGAEITFTSEDGKFKKSVRSGVNGNYGLKLKEARYRVKVTAKGYDDYTTGKGFVVVDGRDPKTSNFFMEEK